MHTSVTCIINNRNIFGTKQALVPCQLPNMFHRTFISQLPSFLSRGKEQALSLFKCIPSLLLVCLCPEAAQMITPAAIQALRDCKHSPRYSLDLCSRSCRTSYAEAHPMGSLTQKIPFNIVTRSTHTCHM